MYDTILFLDFDGTITSEETLEGSMRRTIDPNLYKEKQKEMFEGKITLAEALHMGFETIPTEKLPIILDYVRSVPIRSGFSELLDEMERQGIPVVVISGGLKPTIDEKLAPYRDRLLGVHSVELDVQGPTMRLISDYEEKGDLLQKTLVMEQYEYKKAYCAGDSFTDIQMALISDKVFARDRLAKYLEDRSLPFIPWEDFFDIRDYLKR